MKLSSLPASSKAYVEMKRVISETEPPVQVFMKWFTEAEHPDKSSHWVAARAKISSLI